MARHSSTFTTLRSLSFGLIAAVLAVSACGGDDADNPYKKPLKEIKGIKAPPKMTEEELAEARRKSGHKSQEELIAESSAVFEKGAREYVKARVKKYRKLTSDLRKTMDKIEAEAPKWAEAKSPKKFEKFADKFKAQQKEITKFYDDLTKKGTEGGNTQAKLGMAFRTWEMSFGELTPDMSKNQVFAKALTDIRAQLDKIEANFDEIDKDESLVVSDVTKNKIEAKK